MPLDSTPTADSIYCQIMVHSKHFPCVSTILAECPLLTIALYRFTEDSAPHEGATEPMTKKNKFEQDQEGHRICFTSVILPIIKQMLSTPCSPGQSLLKLAWSSQHNITPQTTILNHTCIFQNKI